MYFTLPAAPFPSQHLVLHTSYVACIALSVYPFPGCTSIAWCSGKIVVYRESLGFFAYCFSICCLRDVCDTQFPHVNQSLYTCSPQYKYRNLFLPNLTCSRLAQVWWVNYLFLIALHAASSPFFSASPALLNIFHAAAPTPASSLPCPPPPLPPLIPPIPPPAVYGALSGACT